MGFDRPQHLVGQAALGFTLEHLVGLFRIGGNLPREHRFCYYSGFVRQLQLLDASDAWLARMGYSRAEIVGRRPEDLSTPESGREITGDYLPLLRRTGRLDNKPVTMLSKDGEVVELVASAIVEYDPAGAYLRTVAVYTDIAEQARVERKYRALYRDTPAMLYIVDAAGRIVTVSDHWLAKLGYRRPDVVGRPITDFMTDRSQREVAGGRLEEIISGGVLNNETRELMASDGSVMEVLVSATPERDSAGRVVRMLVAAKDVTERNRAERRLRETFEENARLREELERERDYLREEVNTSMNFGRIMGESPPLRQMLARLEAVADTSASVLIGGESGVGKELVARALHVRSPRATGPLVKVNCASVPHELFESEFFGHVKGAFTGAHRDRIGRFQLADGGTLFLDEVAEIPIELQGKLLRVLQEKEFERVGDDRTLSVDVRVIAATNKDLEDAVQEGTFREDLYYHLSVFPIDVPPLRDRGDDIIQLATHFLDRAARDFGHPPMTLTRRQADALLDYAWPGNVRELKNVIERAVILSKGKHPRLDLSLPEAGLPTQESPLPPDEPASEGLGFVTDAELREQQRANTIAALEHTGWRVSGKRGAAALLGVKPSTLSDRIRSLGIERPRTKE